MTMIITREKADEFARSAAKLSAALAEHARGYFDEDEIAADAIALVHAVTAARRAVQAGEKSKLPNGEIQRLADKHCIFIKRGKQRAAVLGIEIPIDGVRRYFVAIP